MSNKILPLEQLPDEALIEKIAGFLAKPAYISMSEDQRAAIGLPSNQVARRAYLREILKDG